MNIKDKLLINKIFMKQDIPGVTQYGADQPVSKPYAPYLEVLVLPFSYTSEAEKATVSIPKNWVWDGASIPRIAWLKLTRNSVGSPFLPQYRAASLVHDYLYETQELSKEVADKLLLEILLLNGVNDFEAKKMYLAVKVGGKIPYHKNSKVLEQFKKMDLPRP